jgi:hypothetical protein
VPCLILGDAEPVAVVVLGQARETADGIEREIDRIELDVRDGVAERGAALDAAESSGGNLSRRDQDWPRRLSRPLRGASPRSRCSGFHRQLRDGFALAVGIGFLQGESVGKSGLHRRSIGQAPAQRRSSCSLAMIRFSG